MLIPLIYKQIKVGLGLLLEQKGKKQGVGLGGITRYSSSWMHRWYMHACMYAHLNRTHSPNGPSKSCFKKDSKDIYNWGIKHAKEVASLVSTLQQVKIKF